MKAHNALWMLSQTHSYAHLSPQVLLQQCLYSSSTASNQSLSLTTVEKEQLSLLSHLYNKKTHIRLLHPAFSSAKYVLCPNTPS